MRTGLEGLITASEVFPAAIIVTDSSGRILLANRQTEVLFGYSREELAGQRIELLVPERFRSGHVQHRQGYNAAPRTRLMGLGLDLSARRKDGSEFPVEISLSTAPSEAGMLVVSMIHDISARKTAEEELRLSEERNRSLVENAVMGIYRADPSGRILDANSALAGMLGYRSPEELIGSGAHSRMFEDPEEQSRVVEQLRDEGRIHGFDVVWRSREGNSLTVRLSGQAVRDADGITGFEMIAEDVTQRRALEEQLRHSQKMEGIARLADSIVHDFNNLMAVISTQGELVLEQLAGQPLGRDVQMMVSAAEKAAALTRQLLAFSRRQELAARVFSMNRLIADMDQMLQRLLGSHIHLAVLPAPDLGNVSADPGQMEQVLLNLVVNARDAMPGGGTLTIETANADFDSDYGRDHLDVTPGPHVMLAVSDTGTGMTEEVRTRIFEPFFTTKPAGKGTGLGLSTVYGIVRQSGGHIWVYSELGKGSAFRVYLPRVDAAVTAAAVEQAPASEGGRQERILLVEDEEGLRQSIRTLLEKSGFVVFAAGSAGEAARVCDEVDGRVDLVLTDIGLPGVRGTELVRQLHSRYPGLRVLYMSGFGENAFGPEEISQVSGRLVQKPFKRQTLLQVLNQTLRERRDGPVKE
jgi:PAS domain S-box-containing protein